MSPVTAGNSYWMESGSAPSYPALRGAADADVCVIGGGITGLLSAYELAEVGLRVVLLEAGRIAGLVTGFTTAKLTSRHGHRYHRITEELGAEVARSYGRANQDALARIRQIAATLGIDGDIEDHDAYVYSTRPESVEALQAEARAAAAAGLPATFTDQVPLPFETVGAVRFTDQAQVHPRALLIPLAAALAERGVQIFESSEASEVSHEDRWVMTTEAGQVTADHVVLATMTPTAGVGDELWDQLYCHQGFVVALPLTSDRGPDGALISYERPMRSIRTIKRADGRLLLVGGASYVVQPSTGDSPYDDLEAWAREHFGCGPAAYRWTTQDYSTADGVPLIGAIDPAGLYIAAGFGGWGLTTAAVAAAVIRDLITGAPDPDGLRAVLDPGRSSPRIDSALISAHTSSGTDEDASEIVQRLRPGEAAVVRSGGEQLAVHRQAGGALNVVSAVCTHSGCIVLWDAERAQWSCPCHGSRFEPDGSVSDGPADSPLPNLSRLLG